MVHLAQGLTAWGWPLSSASAQPASLLLIFIQALFPPCHPIQNSLSESQADIPRSPHLRGEECAGMISFTDFGEKELLSPRQ